MKLILSRKLLALWANKIIEWFSSSLSQALDLVAYYSCQPIHCKTIKTFDCQQLACYILHNESQAGMLNTCNGSSRWNKELYTMPGDLNNTTNRNYLKLSFISTPNTAILLGYL